MDLATRERADLIVLSLADGVEQVAHACERLRADEATATVPILVLETDGADTDPVRRAGCNEVIRRTTDPRALQEKIAGALGLRLRRHPRYDVVLPVARGRVFHEFLGYSNSMSEAGMGFDTLARVRGGDLLHLKIYRSTEEAPIKVAGRVCGVRPNIDTGAGYAVGLEFVRLAPADRGRLLELFPKDGCVTWGSDAPDERPEAGEGGVQKR